MIVYRYCELDYSLVYLFETQGCGSDKWSIFDHLWISEISSRAIERPSCERNAMTIKYFTMGDDSIYRSMMMVSAEFKQKI
jgi:hypothetical protein